ncbi:MAG: carotenoid oxygenase family protein [Acidimicrobiia bacterium]
MPLSPSRRDVLKWSALAAGSIPLGALIDACSSESGSRATATTSTTTAAAAGGTPWWLRGNFAPVMREVEAFDLHVQGALPPELDGLYVRNGSNPQHSDSSHWFFGDGMVHGIRLERGKAKWYRNRYVHTALYDAGEGFGAKVPGGSATQSNVSAIWHADTLLTSGEVGFPYRLSPDDLSTIGIHDFAGKLTTAFTAHPKIDPATGLLHAFGYGFTAPFLTYHVADTTGALVHSEVVDIPRSTMIHDFAITDQDAVFWDLPVIFDLDAAQKWIANPHSGVFPYRWDPASGARIGIMPLGGPASAITWHDIDPCYVFHGVNAHRDGTKVVLDVCRLSSMFVPGQDFGGDLTERRWTVDTATGKVQDEVLEADRPGELPNRDPRRVGRASRHGYLVEVRNGTGANFGGLIKRDNTTGRRETWDPGPTVHSGEWLFVPAGDGDADDAGYLMTYVYDDRTGRSQLVVVDATDVTRGPVARVTLPQRVPYGFHGTWVPA